jgi:adenylate kinase family enzyme
LARINEGLVVPAEVTVGLLQTSLLSPPSAVRTILIDGFPRDMMNLEAFLLAGWDCQVCFVIAN